MATKTDKPATDLTTFETFVQRILRVPKAAIDEAEEIRPKRKRGKAKRAK